MDLHRVSVSYSSLCAPVNPLWIPLQSYVETRFNRAVCSVIFLSDLLFNTEDVGNMLLWNIHELPEYMLSYAQIQVLNNLCISHARNQGVVYKIMYV
jgi:hypothetical protein